MRWYSTSTFWQTVSMQGFHILKPQQILNSNYLRYKKYNLLVNWCWKFVGFARIPTMTINNFKINHSFKCYLKKNATQIWHIGHMHTLQRLFELQNCWRIDPKFQRSYNIWISNYAIMQFDCRCFIIFYS